MNGFLTDLTTYQKVFFIISASSTIILIIQTVLALIGIANNNDSDFGESHIVGDGGGDVDIEMDADLNVDIDLNADIESDISLDTAADTADLNADHDYSSFDTDNTSDQSFAHQYDTQGLRLFTIRGIMAFLMMGSWVGFLLSRAGVDEIIASICALVSGIIALFFIAKIMQMLLGLQEDGTMKVKNALGQIGQVYIRIPAEEKGMGKVNVTVQERLCEFDAVTEKSENIKTCRVSVVGIKTVSQISAYQKTFFHSAPTEIKA
jgi:hypothetical protein